MTQTPVATLGGGFLLGSPEPGDVLTPEQFSDEHLMIGRTTEDFVEQQLRPRLQAIEGGDYGTTVELLRQAGGLGILGADVPEEYGGSGLDKAASTLITEKMGTAGSFAISFGAHTGIGTLPIVLFGTDDQKRRYLPRLAAGELIAAYSLTEPDAGSDAQGGKTSARLSEDGRHYVLNGQKQWTTNAGFADLFVVYAKVDGDKLTAFIVERGSEGVSVGPEWAKMGLHGSSTCNVDFNDAKVAAENVLGEIGRGHIIAFNVLNIGRWKLAAGCLGSAKRVLELTARYAQQRQQFGRPIAEYPAIQQKLAQMAARTFALESAVYRTAGLFDKALANATAETASRAIGQYAVEASINKVFGSEVLDFVVDEGVQVHGGYGYIRESEVERLYRDARINRIFEGTNEINRLLIPDTLTRRAMRNEIPLMDAIQHLQAELGNLALGDSLDSAEDPSGLGAEAAQLTNLRRTALLVAGMGFQKYFDRAAEEQEFLLAAADLAILVYVTESALLRAMRAAQSGDPESAGYMADMLRLFIEWAMEQGELVARHAIAGMEEGDRLQVQLSLLRRLFRRTPYNTVKLGRRVGRHVLAAGGYPVGRRGAP